MGRGQTKVESGTAYVRPGVETRGYFTLRLASYTGEEKVGEGMTSFAIIAPADPKLLSNSPFGAMTHFAQGWDIDLLPLLAKAGIASVRDEHYWEHLERTKGVFEFPAVSDQYMSEVKRLGMDVMYAATFGNPHYTGTWDGAPATPEAREAYANYVLQVLDRYPELKTAEIWNEYNGSWCAGEASTDRPRYYAEMMKVVYPRIKAAHPDVQVGGCATVLIPMPYIEGIFKHGGLPYMDAVVIHPYRMQPEGVEVEIAELQELIRRYNDGRDKPIWVTETGAMPKQEEYEWERGSGMFEKARAHVARYLVRQYTLLHSTGTVERIYWYLARDYNEFKLMGLLRDAKDPAGRYAVASPYVAYANLIRQLHGTRPVGRASVESKFTYIMQFDRDGEQVRVCWATQPASVALQVSEPVAVVDMMGYERTLAPVAGHVYLTLSDSPVYVIGRVEKVIEGGAFRLAGQQTTDLLAPYGFNVEITDPAIRGAIRVLGKDLPVDGRGTRLTIDGVDTSQLRRDELSYVLMVNGRPAGMGQFQLSVVDPLSFSGASDFIAADTLRLILANESYRQGYQVAGLEWSLNDLGRTVAVETTIPERSEFELDLPVGEVQPYRSCVAECAVLFGGGRRPVRHRVDASYNPCIKRDVTLDGDETDWAQVPEMDVAQCFQARGEPMAGKVRIAWSERELHLFARVSAKASFQFAIAPDYRGKWIEADNLRGWYEIRVDANGAVTTIQSPSGERVSAKAVTKQVDDQVVHEISVPIADMLQLEPKADASFRLALLIEDGQRSAAWGSGIRDGHTPDGFRICRFVDGELPVHGERLVITPREMMQRARVNEVTPLADSVDDYSQTQGKNRWFYGYYAGDGKGQGDGQAPHRPYTDDDFRPMVHEQTIWGYTWKGDAPFNTQSADSMHPGRLDGRDVWAVRRWQSPITGTVRIAGRFIRGEQGDGIDGKILVDGVLVYSTPVGGPSHPGEVDFEVDVPVVTGSLVDIAVTPGGASNIDYDVTVVRAKISRVQ